MNSRTSNPAPGHLFVVSAPSGGGKTSLVRALLAHVDGLHLSISHTTRACRQGERDGVDYHFVDEARFAAMVAAGDFLEHARVFDHHYGTSRNGIAERIASGADVILEIDWQGARSVRARLDNAISIFILPPSVEELQRRLAGRGDSPEGVARRMRDAVDEISHYGEYDYLVVNDDFDTAAAALSAIVLATRQRQAAQRVRHAALLTRLVAP